MPTTLPIPNMQAYRHSDTIFFAVYGTVRESAANPTGATGWNYPVFRAPVRGMPMQGVSFHEYPGLSGIMPSNSSTNPRPTIASPVAHSPYPRYTRQPRQAALDRQNGIAGASTTESAKFESAFVGIQRGTFVHNQIPMSYADYLLYLKAMNMQIN